MTTATLKGQTSKDEAAIRALIESVHKAHHNKDAAAIVAPYTKDSVVCDLAPPLSRRGIDLQAKQAWLDTWEGPVDRESRDFNAVVSGDFAFCHGFYRLSGTPKTAAGRSASGCAQRCACIEMGALGGSSTSTSPCPSTWMAACGPPLTSSPKERRRYGINKSGQRCLTCRSRLKFQIGPALSRSVYRRFGGVRSALGHYRIVEECATAQDLSKHGCGLPSLSRMIAIASRDRNR